LEIFARICPLLIVANQIGDFEVLERKIAGREVAQDFIGLHGENKP
jgi:hypothetical protein